MVGLFTVSEDRKAVKVGLGYVMASLFRLGPFCATFNTAHKAAACPLITDQIDAAASGGVRAEDVRTSTG